jgi:dihydrofolate synthase/folylpolyglutamate synthase
LGAPPGALELWLQRIERLHPRTIDMGLARVRRVWEAMGRSLPGVLFLVGGTNGKGSTCAMLDAIVRAAGYRAGRYGSPHLARFQERLTIDGREVDDGELIAAFERVEAARLGTSLTYFEFTTLAVFDLLSRAPLDACILEIGLGGRLDAVNLVDADCAIVTAIDLDHVDLLGPTRELIGAEKAAIFRHGRPAVVVDADPPASLVRHAAAIGAPLAVLGRDFRAEPLDAQGPARSWNFRGLIDGRSCDRPGLPWPALRGPHQLANAAGALAALAAVSGRLPVHQQAVREGLLSVALPGRYQVLPGRPVIVLDVGHNPQAARALAGAMQAHGFFPRTRAVFGMLRDKDAAAVVAPLARHVYHWHLVPTSGERGREAGALRAQAFAARSGAPEPGAISEHESVGGALRAALDASDPDDRIIVFGSFVVVAEALRWLERDPR